MTKKSDLAKLQQRVYTLEQRVKKYRKLDKLDGALLSFSAVLGLLIPISNFLLGGFGVISFMPALVMVWLMPSYVLLKTESSSIELTEHIRVWVYFFTGLVFYLAMTFLSFISFYTPWLKDTSGLLITAVAAAAILIIWIFVPNKRIAMKIFKWYTGKVKRVPKEIEKKVYDTGFNAILSSALISSSSAFIYLGCLLISLSWVGAAIIFIIGMVLLVWGFINLRSFEQSIKFK